MNLQNYRAAIRYASGLNHDHRYDLVHDAYLVWYRKTNNNLFNQHQGVVIQTVKNIHGGILTKNTFMYNGIKYIKGYSDIKDLRRPSNEHNPEHILMIQDIKDNLELVLAPHQKEVYYKLQEGYTPVEIAEEQGTYRQLVSGHIRHIRNKLAKLN